jgi:ABC-type branched-subunit amino acid transport system substrate-binding protein
MTAHTTLPHRRAAFARRGMASSLHLALGLTLLFGCGARAQDRRTATPDRPIADAAPAEPQGRRTAPHDAGASAATDAAPPIDEDAPPDRVPTLPGRVLGAPPGRQVVVLLPLSGRSARLGADLAAGLAAARGAPDTPGPDIVVRDAPDGATAATELRTVANRGPVAGVIGVVDRAGAEAVVPAALDTGVATVLLTPSDVAVSQPGRVWRALHTPALVVRTAAGAALARGGREALIVRPRSAAGESYATLFRSVWAAGGGLVSGDDIDYDAAKPDWKDVSRRIGERPADTIFFPEGAVNAAQGLAMMAHHGLWSRSGAPRFEKSKVREFLVLGTPEWYAPEVMRQSGRYFEGALFPVAFALESVAGARLAARFSAAGHAPPTVIDGLLWDAVLAVDKAARRAESEGITTAAALPRETSAEATVGLRFDAPDAVQNLYVLTVKDGRFTAAR